ncbi:hypothetical protein TNCT_548741, partial [Trichonephila clavata]
FFRVTHNFWKFLFGDTQSIKGMEKEIGRKSLNVGTDPPLPAPQSAVYNVMESSSEVLQKYYCDVCKKQCTNSDSYDLHVLNSAHQRKVRIAKRNEKATNIQASGVGSSSKSIEANSFSNAGGTSTLDKVDNINNKYLVIKAKNIVECFATGLLPPFSNLEASLAGNTMLRNHDCSMLKKHKHTTTKNPTC